MFALRTLPPESAACAVGFAKTAAHKAARPGRGGPLSRQAGARGSGHLSASGAGDAVNAMIRRRREKVFGPGRAVPLDRNAKARILAYARAWGARHRQPGQHKGPITRAFLEVLEALLWGFHNSRTGCCFPSLRGDRRQGGVRAQHRRRGAEGPGVGRRADLAEPDHPYPSCASATCSAAGRAAGGSSAPSTPTCSAIRSPAFPAAFRLSPKIRRNTESRVLSPVLAAPASTRTALWSVPCSS